MLKVQENSHIMINIHICFVMCHFNPLRRNTYRVIHEFVKASFAKSTSKISLVRKEFGFSVEISQ